MEALITNTDNISFLKDWRLQLLHNYHKENCQVNINFGNLNSLKKN